MPDPQTVAGWARRRSAPGQPQESAQERAAFNVTNNTNPGLFAWAPSIDASGTLSYTPAANASGASTLTVVVVGNGETIQPARTWAGHDHSDHGHCRQRRADVCR